MGRGSPTISPDAASISTIARCACFTVRPAMARQASPSSTPGGGVSVMRPERVTMLRVGRLSSRHHTTSVTSPNVQIMAMPDPLSGSARRWASTGTSTPKSGVCTLVPKRAA